ncbi:MAG: MFS transporter, partial [Chitinophagaceae bacterium]
MNKHLKYTVVLLCMGYAMDFYDLTIFSVGYYDISRELFGIYDVNMIQKLRLSITNWQNLGVVLGAFFFGALGDKIGRVKIIKYSILLYSLSTLLSPFIQNIFLFTALRFLAGVGLACEFSTSNVLITELLSKKWANWSS